MSDLSLNPAQEIQKTEEHASSREQVIAIIPQGFTIIKKCITAAVTAKNSNWDREEYRQYVIESYKEINRIKDAYEKEKKEPLRKDVEKTLGLLKIILIYKKIPEARQKKLLMEILEETRASELFENLTI